jgi:hypothetical protein
MGDAPIFIAQLESTASVILSRRHGPAVPAGSPNPELYRLS